MLKAFQYRLYPTKEQECLLESTLETLRHLYNNALAQRIDAYQYEGKTIGYLQQQNQLPLLKKQAESLNEIYSQVAQDCLRRLDKAYQNFFRRVKLGLEKPGFPRFKGIGRYRSFTYPVYGSAARIVGKLLHLSKIGAIPIRVHRPWQGIPKTCTIRRKADGWYASLACEVEPELLPKTGLDVGIDMGIENFATLSDDHETIANPRYLQKAHKHLRQAQRRLQRRSNYVGTGKQRKLAAKQSKRRGKAKLDFIHLGRNPLDT